MNNEQNNNLGTPVVNPQTNPSVNGMDNTINQPANNMVSPETIVSDANAMNQQVIAPNNNVIGDPNAFGNLNQQQNLQMQNNMFNQPNGMAQDNMNNQPFNGFNNGMAAPNGYNNFNQTPMGQPNYNNNLTPEIPKKKNPAVAIVIAVVAVTLAVVGGILGYKFFIMSSPTKIIDKSIDTLASKFDLTIQEYNNKIKSASKMLNELYVELNGSSLELTTKFDMDKKLIGAAAKAKMDGSELLNVSGVLAEDAIYFKLKEDSINNYAYFEDFSELFATNDTLNELDPVLINFVKHMGDSFKETITEDMFVKSKEQIDIDGKNQKVTKYNLVLDEKTINPFLNNYENKLKNDNELITYLIKLLNEAEGLEGTGLEYEKSDIKELFEEMIDDMKYDPDYSEPVNLALYVKGSNLVKLSIYNEDNTIDMYVGDGIKIVCIYEDEETMVFEYKEDNIIFKSYGEYGNNIEFEYKKDYIKFRAYDEYEDLVDFELKNGNYELTLTNYEMFITGTLKEIDNGAELTFSTKIDEQKYEGLVRIKVTYPATIDLKVPSGALDLENETYMEFFKNELQSTPFGLLISSYLEDDYDYDYDYEDDFSDFDSYLDEDLDFDFEF